MKKLLGISLVAVLAVSPLMANAAPGQVVSTGTTPVTVNPQPANAEAASTAGLTTGSPYYALATEAETDGNAASAGYVKGAYNAAIKAVNSVHAEVASITSDALTTAGAGLAKDGNTVNVNAGDGIKIDNDNVAVDYANGLAIDAQNKLAVKQGAGIAVDANGVSADVDDNTIEVGANGLQVKQITTTNVAAAAMSTGSANNDKLTTQGYVDDAISGLNIGTYATQEGVEQTIKNVTLTQGTVTQGLTGSLTSGTVASIMTTWGNDTAKTDVTAVTGLGDLNTSVSVAAPTITVNSVDYAEPVAEPETPNTGA